MKLRTAKRPPILGLQVASIRCIVLPRKADPRKSAGAFRHSKSYPDRQNSREEHLFRQKIKDMQKLTSQMSGIVASKQAKKEQEAGKRVEVSGVDTERASDHIYDEINRPKKLSATGLLESPDMISSPILDSSSQISTSISPKATHLYVPAQGLDIPESIQNKLGLTLKYLVSERAQNWPMVFLQLRQSGGFEDIPGKDVRRFLRSVPKSQMILLIPATELLLAEAKVETSQKIIDIYIRALVQGSKTPDMKEITRWIDLSRLKSKKGALPRATYELAVAGAGKSGDFELVNSYLKEMTERGLEPLKDTFSNVLTTAVYKAKNHKQACEVFDTMKFVSTKTKPSSKNYQDIIVLHVNHDMTEKAMDLWVELNKEKIEPTQQTLAALARACAMRKELKPKAWDFIFHIHEKGWEPSMDTYEWMMYLSANDGDVGLTRALYGQLHQQSAKAFSFLMLSYSNYDPSKRPIIELSDKGKNFRRNLLIAFDGGSRMKMPFLPLLENFTKKQILAESNALWTFTAQQNPHLMNERNTDMFLKVAVNQGTLGDFVERYEKFTKLDLTGVAKTRVIKEIPNEDAQGMNETERMVEKKSGNDISEAEDGSDLYLGQPGNDVNKEDESNRKSKEEDIQLANMAKQQEDMELKIEEKMQTLDSEDNSNVAYVIENEATEENSESRIGNSTDFPVVYRNTQIYRTAIAAAAKFHKYEFAQTVWKERGMFRKSHRFSSMSRAKKDREDFEFAQSMVHALVDMGMLTDACAVVVSTEYQFKWQWIHLSRLYHAAVEVGDSKVALTCKGISSRSLIKHEGRINRKIYKEFVSRRGY